MDRNNLGRQDIAIGYETRLEGVAGIFNGPLPRKIAMMPASLRVGLGGIGAW